MGTAMSFIPKALSYEKLLDKVYDSIFEADSKGLTTIDDFHVSILRILNGINSCMPGMHYDPPSYKEVEEFFNALKGTEGAKEEERTTKEAKKEKIIKFILDHTVPTKPSKRIVLSGIAAPFAALGLKRGGEQIPQLSMLKVIPDYVFVPTVTLGTIVSVTAYEKDFFQSIVGAK